MNIDAILKLYVTQELVDTINQLRNGQASDTKNVSSAIINHDIRRVTEHLLLRVYNKVIKPSEEPPPNWRDSTVKVVYPHQTSNNQLSQQSSCQATPRRSNRSDRKPPISTKRFRIAAIDFKEVFVHSGAQQHLAGSARTRHLKNHPFRCSHKLTTSSEHTCTRNRVTHSPRSCSLDPYNTSNREVEQRQPGS